MSRALFIVLQQPVPAVDAFVNGKALAAAEKVLADLCSQLGARPLMDFFSIDPATMAGVLSGSGVDIEQIESPDVKWYEASEGLSTVSSLLNHIRANPACLDNALRVITDLEEFHRVLTEAQSRGIRWHLEVDF